MTNASLISTEGSHEVTLEMLQRPVAQVSESADITFIMEEKQNKK